MTDTTGVPGFKPSDLAQFARLWSLLAPYLERQEYYLVGGAAIRLQLRQHHCSPEFVWRTFRDDEYNLVVNRPDALRPAMFAPGSGFVLLHYHLDGPPGSTNLRPFWRVMHPASRTRFNIFSPRYPDIPTNLYNLLGLAVPVQNLLDQFLSILQDCLKPRYGQAVDPKQIQDVNRLWPLIQDQYSLKEIEHRWKERQPRPSPTVLECVGPVIRYPEGSLIKVDPHRPTKLQLLGMIPRRGCSQCIHHLQFRPARGITWMWRWLLRH